MALQAQKRMAVAPEITNVIKGAKGTYRMMVLRALKRITVAPEITNVIEGATVPTRMMTTAPSKKQVKNQLLRTSQGCSVL